MGSRHGQRRDFHIIDAGAGNKHRCGRPQKTAKNQLGLDSPLISKRNGPVGQVSMQRRQRVQSGPIGIDIEADAVEHAGAP